MSESLPKIAIPISISHGRDHAQDVKPVHRLLRHYEQRSVVVKALMWGVLIGFIGFLIDYSIGRLHWSWFTERIVENTFEGTLLTLLIWAFLKAREKGLQKRFKQVGYLNHHVRNSLTVIEMAGGYVPEASQRLEMIKSASTRIRRCIEKVSREEDCEINPQAPQEP